MMAAPKIDVKYTAFLSQGVAATAEMQLDHPVGAATAALAHELLADTLADYQAARDKIDRNRLHADRASAQLDLAEFHAGEVFPLLYNDFKAHRWTLQNGPTEAADRFDEDLGEVLGGVTPSRFPELGINRTIALIDAIADFGALTFGASHRHVTRAKLNHDELCAARSADVKTKSDLQLAMTELHAARKFVRRNYSAARKMVIAALELEESDDIHSIMPSLDVIYRSSAGAEPAEQ
jgi:hypothetical protein